MKKLFVLLFSLLINSCANLETGRIAPGYAEAFNAFNILIFGHENNIDQSIIENIPYASALVQIGKGPIGLMILESKKDGVESWITADGINILIKDGRIIQTFGLSNNLTSLVYPKLKMNNKQTQKHFFYYSYDNPFLNNLKVEVSSTIKNKELVNILGTEKELTKIEEAILSKDIRWKARNVFWMDDIGYIWKTEQAISPKLPKFRIQVTKKPSI